MTLEIQKRIEIEFDPVAKVPRFVVFLEEHWDSEVEFGKGGLEVLRPGFDVSSERQAGISVVVMLGGEKIGNLNVYENPNALRFEGEIPGIAKYGQKGIGATDKIVLIKTPRGRKDRWEVPFP